MGLLGDIWNGVKSFFGGGSSCSGSRSSSYSTVYEPDKVKVAEINKEKEIELAKLNGIIQRGMIEAQVQGLVKFNESLGKLMKELNIVAEQQFKLMESSSLEAIKNIESYYRDFGNSILNDRNDFDDKFIEMLKKLEQFPKDSAQYKIYSKRLDGFAEGEVEFFTEALRQIQIKQQKLIDSTLENKKLINEKVSAIVAKRLEEVSATLAKSKALLENSKAKVDEVKEIPYIESK